MYPEINQLCCLRRDFWGGHESAITTIMIIKHCRYAWGFTCISQFLLDIFKRFALSGKIFSMSAGDPKVFAFWVPFFW